MAKQYADQAQFLIVYIKEAHPAEDWPMRVNQRLKFIKDPTTLFERFQVANTCMNDLEISIPCLIDDLENSTAKAYKGMPDRLYIISKEGKIAYQGPPGPGGFNPSRLEGALKFELKRMEAQEAKSD